MNFTVLFHLIGNLNFHVQFSLHSANTQDFFFFQGENSSAHLYRNNETVSLYLRDDKEFELYQIHILNELDFSWRGFKVNGTDMRKIKSTGVTNMEGLNEFTFLTVVVDLQADVLMNPYSPNVSETITEGEFMQSLNFKNVNYGYIAGIMLLIVVVLELKIKIPLIIERLFGQQIENDFAESDNEIMEILETHV